MIIEPATPQDMPALAALADRIFRSRRPDHHMADEFPYLYAQANAAHWMIAREGDAIVSMLGAMVWPAVIAGAPTRAAAVGSVATDPAYRGQGLASRLLQEAQAQLRLEQVRLMLISGDLPLYTRFGARPVGQVDWYALHPDQSPTPYEVQELDPRHDAPAVARLAQGRPTRWSRPYHELVTMLTNQPLTTVEQGQKVARLIRQHGQPVAYALVNHRPFGGSEPSRLVEWGGDPKGVLAALRQWPDWPEQGLWVPVTTDDWALAGLLADEVPVQRTAAAWLAKVIDGVGLWEDLGVVLNERGPGLAPLEAIGADQYQYQGQTLDAPSLTRAMFSPNAERPEAWADIFPLPTLWPEGLNYI